MRVGIGEGHRLLIKLVTQQPGGQVFAFAARLADAEGKPPAGVRTQVSDPDCALAIQADARRLIALGNFGPAGATGPAVQQGGPSLEEYDAGQRGLAPAPTTTAAPAAPQAKAENYTVRFQLDLKALRIPETARA